MRQLILEFVLVVVKHPDSVRLTEERSKGHIRFRLYVMEGDAGRVIGENGKCINAMRTLLKAMNSSPQVISLILTITPQTQAHHVKDTPAS